MTALFVRILDFSDSKLQDEAAVSRVMMPVSTSRGRLAPNALVALGSTGRRRRCGDQLRRVTACDLRGRYNDLGDYTVAAQRHEARLHITQHWLDLLAQRGR